MGGAWQRTAADAGGQPGAPPGAPRPAGSEVITGGGKDSSGPPHCLLCWSAARCPRQPHRQSGRVAPHTGVQVPSGALQGRQNSKRSSSRRALCLLAEAPPPPQQQPQCGRTAERRRGWRGGAHPAIGRRQRFDSSSKQISDTTSRRAAPPRARRTRSSTLRHAEPASQRPRCVCVRVCDASAATPRRQLAAFPNRDTPRSTHFNCGSQGRPARSARSRADSEVAYLPGAARCTARRAARP